MRYDQLLKIIDDIKPEVIIEVGVAMGDRAVAMCNCALSHRRVVHYIGFDVFETKDQEFHKAAYNLKKVGTVESVKSRLAGIQVANPSFVFNLIVGDTRETLHGKTFFGDLAFIDGDHRVDAIRADYEALKHIPVVVLDDYYTLDERGSPDISKVGCNYIVAGMNGRAELLPMSDQVRDGGRVQMAVVR